ncbi:aldose epimerase family protein [Tenacibaculum jejuense]|uniref:Aldose 1-epimerase n=1 Tax=Tenacibaculum jejuense TaxID=584609 RepID=A0A238UDZ9_9FLAO|nr:aldose epimerase family protein [Tenacibaculum jejuense]SNR16630.1 Aldose 1-epimerase [Tenacibaculum jejuense]
MNIQKTATIIQSSIKLTNKNGMELVINPFGATIISLKVPNKNNQLTETILNLHTEEEYYNETYLKERIYLGSTVGRYAGRISNKSFRIDDEVYELYHDNNYIHLHGGKNGFDRKMWNVKEILENEERSELTLSYESKHLEEGYPGNLNCSATFILTNENTVHIIYSAITDRKTHVNLTNHNYYNLNGNDSILEHKLQLNCDQYLEVDKNLIPSGKLLDVNKTKYDYRKLKTIGENNFEGLDDTFIFNQNENKIILSSATSGIQMKISTNQPAVVIYTPLNFDHLNLRNGSNFSNYPGICFETQKYPDTPNNAHFPSTLLEPGKEYKNETTLSFSLL